MQNLKIRVNNEAESKEAQELFFELGLSWLSGSKKAMNLNSKYLYTTDDERFYCGDHHQTLNESVRKEITLPELREMANPMKEYLEKQPDGTYSLVLRGDLCKESDILIPEGAEAFGYTGIVHTFYKDDFRSYFNENTNGQWDTRSETWIVRKEPVILWQREQDEPFLTPECTLNDQYAEIEEVRQHKKHERNSSAWDTQVGGSHYKQFKIQPMQFALENRLDAAQQNVIKYIMRHSFKNGKQDLEKAKHYIDLMIEFYYGENNNG